MLDMIGIDEVGRGAWAGPLLVVAARECAKLPDGLADSKVLSRAQRTGFCKDIQACCNIGEGWVDASEIDEYGLTIAMRLGVEQALAAIDAQLDEDIIMDGHINYCAPEFTNVQTVIDADAAHPIVSAASIYAKVTRDNYMAELNNQFPQYGFDTHVGYGTARHKAALATHGVTLLHRKSYKPVAMYK